MSWDLCGAETVRRCFIALMAVALVTGLAVPSIAQEDGVGDPEPTEEVTDLRVGVLALADTIAALGRHPTLAEPLPFTRTSATDALRLDDVVGDALIEAMAGTDLIAALELVPGIVDVDSDEPRGDLSFGYRQNVSVPLGLAYDDGNLRFGKDGAGTLLVTLQTPPDGERFILDVDEDQEDPLLRFALVSEPELELLMSVETPSLPDFRGSQGFTELEFTGGHYRVKQTADITLRDPNGRGLLTLEDLRYSTLVDLFRVESRQGDPDEVDIRFNLELPAEVQVAGTADPDAARKGSLTLTGTGPVPPDPETATPDYGAALAVLTGLNAVDGITAFAEYTGAALALQHAADVDFPNLGGSLTDVFAPGDELLEILATAAVAELRCGLTPDNPPLGVGSEGNTIYCDAVTAAGIEDSDIVSVDWSTADGVMAGDTTDKDTVGSLPTATIQIDASDGWPDVSVAITLKGDQVLTARTLPRTIQEITGRIGEISRRGLAGHSVATVNLGTKTLDVSVDITAETTSAELTIGDPATVGALVGLTGLESPPTGSTAATASAVVEGASFDVGLAIPIGEPDERSVVLAPKDATLFEVNAISAGDLIGNAALTDMDGRVGFLKVSVDVPVLTLTRALDTIGPIVALHATNGDANIALNDLFTEEGIVAPGVLELTSHLEAGVTFEATEEEIDVDTYVTGAEPAMGRVSVVWGPDGFPRVESQAGYPALRVFDPVTAVVLRGYAKVVQTEVSVHVTEPAGINLYDALGAVDGDANTELARHLIGPGVGCQSITIKDAVTLTCEGLAPNGAPAFNDGDPVDLVALGDPFFLRDQVFEGLARALNEFEWLTGDNVDGDGLENDQYTSTLPMIDLRPDQMAPERGRLAGGIRDLIAAAAEDKAGLTGGDFDPVSSAQELRATAPTLVAGASIVYTLDDTLETLGITLTSATSDDSLEAALRFVAPVPGTEPDDPPLTGQVVADTPLAVCLESTTKLDLSVAVGSAVVSIGEHTSTESTASMCAESASFVDTTFQAGVGTAQISEGTAELGIKVSTIYKPNTATFETTRTSALELPGNDDDSPGAKLTLSVQQGDETELVSYEWPATASSGGAGAPAPTPEPMQVTYLAEGLEGLASALDLALDGAAPRTVGPEGVPISAPLIGTNLDAGAEVGDALRSLLTDFRLALPNTAEPTDPLDAGDVRTALALAFDGLLAEPDAVHVDCGTDADDTDDCDDKSASTDWDRVAVDLALSSSPLDATLPFSVGLDGLAVRSNVAITATTSWDLSLTLELVRGVGPRVALGDGGLSLTIEASLPTDTNSSPFDTATTAEVCTEQYCLPAIVGYLPALLTANGTDGELHTTVRVDPAGTGSYTLFELLEGPDDLKPTFEDSDGHSESGLRLGFATVASDFGSFDLEGVLAVPWTNADQFSDGDPVTYDEVKLDVGEVISTLATPFAMADPYLGPARDVIDVLRTPIPVVSDLSELAGAGEVSLLSLLDKLAQASGDEPAPNDPDKKKTNKLELAYNIISFIDTSLQVVDAVAVYAEEEVPLAELNAAGALLTVEPRQLALHSSCTETVRSLTIKEDAADQPGDDTEYELTHKWGSATAKCPDEETTLGLQSLKVEPKRRGERETSADFNLAVTQRTSTVTASMPGFSLPFLNDPEQLIDMLTGEGEATYFRMDLGTLSAQVAYSVKFAPIPIGPVPVQPFVGGSIGIEGRLALGFDSMPQTLAVQSLDDPGDIVGLVTALKAFDGGDILREAFYLDDLDADGVDVPEVKLIATIEAGAGISIGIVSAGLKGGITLTINLDLNDPSDDGRLRIAEIRDDFAGKPECIFDVSATLEAFLKFFFEIDLFFTSFGAEFYIVRLGPYTLFKYSCGVAEPQPLVAWTGNGLELQTTGDDDNFEVRQFDTDGGAAAGGATVFEVAARNLVQRVDAVANGDGTTTMRIYSVATLLPTEVESTFPVANPADVVFVADGKGGADQLSFLEGETYDDEGTLVSTPFAARAEVKGGPGADDITTGDAGDIVDGGAGNDTINAGAGNDLVTGGPDNDALGGGAGIDNIDGGDGDDTIKGGPAADLVVGGMGKDVLVGGPGRNVDSVVVSGHTKPFGVDPPIAEDIVLQVNEGFDSGDILIGGGGDDVVDGADGSDIVIGGEYPIAEEDVENWAIALLGAKVTRTVSVLYQGETNPMPVPVEVPTAIIPTETELDDKCESGVESTVAAGNDVVTGGPEADVVIGGDGSDNLTGGAGSDELCGRAGDDFILGDNTAEPESNATAETGEPTFDDNDVIRGGTGDDRISAGPGNDVVFGDDSRLFRGGQRILDGSLGANAAGSGNDYVDAGPGDDIVAGGRGSDLLVGGKGNDVVLGEGREGAETSGESPQLRDRIIDCRLTTRVIRGHVDLNGDLLAEGDVAGVDPDDGQLAGLTVSGGTVLGPDGDPFTGLIGDAVVVINGLVDLDRDGNFGDPDAGELAIGSEDTGLAAAPSMLGTTSNNPNGDCILGGAGADALLGGLGSDYVGGGFGTDLIDGDEGHDLLLGDADTDVLMGGLHDDVLVGGEGADHLAGGPGNDRLRGNEDDDDLIGGGETGETIDGQDVLLGGRGNDLLAGEHAEVTSRSIMDAVAEATWQNAGFDVPAAVLADPTRAGNSAVRCSGDPVGPADRWITILPGGPEERVADTPADSDHDWYDELYGGSGCDWVFGQEGDDLVRGGQGDDIVEGGPDSDTGLGDAGDDIVVGGSSVNVAADIDDPGAIVDGRSATGAPDGHDLLLGDGGPDGGTGSDVLIGDNGTPVWGESGSDNAVFLADLWATSVSPVSGHDVLVGDGGIEASWAFDYVDGQSASLCAELSEAADPTGMRDYLFGQGGDDCLAGSAAGDYLEGGPGADSLLGGHGDDEMIGGSSARDGAPMGADGLRLRESLGSNRLVDPTAAGLVDGGDVISGGIGNDVALGDNGRITRPVGMPFDELYPVRQVAMADTTVGATSGSDTIHGDEGDDVLYGQLDDTSAYVAPDGQVGDPLGRTQELGTGDLLFGGDGVDVVVGDLAVIVLTPPNQLGPPQILGLRGTAIAEPVYQPGTLVPRSFTTRSMVEQGGADVARGGNGDDIIRLGAGDDLANGGSGNDVLFGALGVDAMWGGPDHDRQFGGYGADLLDIKPRDTDPQIYFEVATIEDTDQKRVTHNDADLLYGGWGPDELQADIGGSGRDPMSDHLVDWVGNHNVFYVCGGSLGRGKVIRSASPALRALLTSLAIAAGATEVDTPNSGGWHDLGLVRRGDNSDNSRPHPNAPGNFTCEEDPPKKKK